MSQANSTPLSSVAASVKVVGRGVDWDDVVLRYSPSVDAIVIDLTPAESVIDNTVPLDAPLDTFLDVDTAGKAVHIEFLDASDVFACHFYDRSDDVDGHGYAFGSRYPFSPLMQGPPLRPLEWRAKYESDRLTVSFVRNADQRAVAVADMGEGILMHTDSAGRIVALSIADAIKTVHRQGRS
ncbi:hypothetical protein psal_cds_1154 [Pandoravirus salinus]|uniref:Uncharacterized protein n=1 Tax=Pandoravirus salinus TaxID=1349410 RepID=A0A291AU28_9VIRU|nr:hypothetical protein psal_cds_1154 [Pandoravirus salinus]ATE82288.1 hypothetical protein psal_cds_1154 [Pandoravirus salinus]